MRPLGTEHPPRAILAAHEVNHLDHLVSRSSYPVKLILQLSKRVPAKSFSVGLAWSSVDGLRRQGTPADQVDGDGGAEACSSTPQAASTSTAGRPPAAAGGLVSQVPDLVLGPRQPLTLASCSKLVEEIRPAPSA